MASAIHLVRPESPCTSSPPAVDNDGIVKPFGVVVASALGLCIGSFLNVAIGRIPNHESVVSPRSRCPQCGTPIASRDNIPLISWILLKGHCRACGLAISVQYPLVELATAVLFGATAWHFGLSWNLAMFLVLFAGLIPLMAIDFNKHLIPVRILYPTLVADAAILLGDSIDHRSWRALGIALLASAIWFGAFFIINSIRPEALGFGDVRLVALIGLCLGWLGVPIVFVGFFASNILGIAVGVTLIATKHATRKSQIPLGVFLGIGTIFAVFAGPSIASQFSGLR
jgi:leader peptidase (prepilin peptidase)/N-methyltransferase